MGERIQPFSMFSSLCHAVEPSIVVFLAVLARRLIAATYTPMVAVPLVHDPLISRRLLVRVWMTALGGAAKTWLWPNGPRFLSALTYVAMGWSCLPYLPLLTAAVDSHVVILVSVLGHCATSNTGMCSFGTMAAASTAAATRCMEGCSVRSA